MNSSILTVSRVDSVLQLVTVLLIFIGVLVITYFTTRWIANYQKGQNVNRNIEVIETFRLTANKYVQIIRIGETYLVIAVSKDQVTLLSEIPEDQLVKPDQISGLPNDNFKEILDKARKLITKK